MLTINAYYKGEFLGVAQTHTPHSLNPGDIVTVRNLVCGDTCKAKILQHAEYTDRFFTNRFLGYQWCANVSMEEPWRPPQPPAHAANCTQQCNTTSGRRSAALRLTWHSDPGHAWLAVPVQMIGKTGISKEISPFSYISPAGRTAYLEEDSDAPRFLQACREQGIQISTTERHTNHSHRIRRLQSYSPAGAKTR